MKSIPPHTPTGPGGEARLAVTLLAATPDAERVVAAAARVCTSRCGAAELAERLPEARVGELLAALEASGHDSPLEHASFTFAVEGVSRALSHQLVRHRIASYTQQSQRYVDAGGFEYVVPPAVAADAAARERFVGAMEACRAAYAAALEAAPREDARYLLPNAAATRLVVTMNARALRHFFRLRLCERAQWEIRGLAARMLDLCRAAAPRLFDRAGPACETEGRCPEGPRGCGRLARRRAAVPPAV